MTPIHVINEAMLHIMLLHGKMIMGIYTFLSAEITMN
jgi:hypothetical protein